MVCLLILLLGISIAPVLAADTVELEITEDTYVEEKYPSIVTWNNRNLYIGTDTLYGKGKTRTLVKATVGRLRELDIISSDISRVELLLHQYYYEGTDNTATIDAYTTVSPWDMDSVTWSQQPAISPKRDSTTITTTGGEKSINITNSFLEIMKSVNPSDRGILLKVNPETDKALIFWAHGCTLAPTSPRCDSESLRPKIRITLRGNSLPTLCKLLTPNPNESTSKEEVAFKADVSLDNEGDKIGYTLRVCAIQNCSSPLLTQPISTVANSYISLPQGTYIASCSADDGHTERVWGDEVTFTIDRTPPNPPRIIQEPYYTNSENNTVFWLPLEDTVECQLLSSERADFKSYNTYGSWTTNNFANVLHTKEKTYFYKLRARDAAGNLSEWSDFVSTTIDIKPPILRYFKVNNNVISPKFGKNGIPTTNIYLQGAAEDTTHKSLVLVIRDSQFNTVYSETELEKSYLWTRWPDSNKYPDGDYIAILIAEDAVGYISESDPIFLRIDTTPPRPPLIYGISKNQATPQKKLTITSICPDKAVGNLYSGGKIVSENKNMHKVLVTYTDGEHTIKATCTDDAGNISSKSMQFIVDTSPPSKPSLSIEEGEGNFVHIKATCREEARTELYINGIYYNAGTCTPKTPYKKIIQLSNITSLISFTARTIDKAGNKSDLSEFALLRSNTKAKADTEVVTCTTSHHYTDAEFKDIDCEWPQKTIDYMETIPLDTQNEKSVFHQLQLKDPKIYITTTSCKAKSLWDPRTWYGCVKITEGTITVFGKLYPLYFGGTKAQLELNNNFSFSHKVAQSIKIEVRYLLIFSATVGDSTLTATTTSPAKEVHFQLVKKQNIKRFFGWLFSSLVQVSQWYGKTAYDKAHSGIDFAVNKTIILAPADGKIIAAGYHRKDPCNAGGYYIGVKYDNGLYTYFFHLASLKYPNNKKITVGDTVKKGSTLAISGNSGNYKCEPLLAHLHFEVRTGNSSLSHTNPVPHFSIDWNSIVTANSKTYPKRLTGENPHPKF